MEAQAWYARERHELSGYPPRYAVCICDMCFTSETLQIALIELQIMLRLTERPRLARILDSDAGTDHFFCLSSEGTGGRG